MGVVKDRLIELCDAALIVKSLSSDERYVKRLKLELKAVDDVNDYDYFLDLHNRQVKIPENESNLLIPHLLDIVADVDIDKDPAYVWGEFPDIDVDFKKDVRVYLKNEWAPRTFGPVNVCNIGSYSTFGIKSALIDMARVFGEDRQEILKVTTRLSMKDEDGKVLTWERALELNKDLAVYCEKHKDLADAARRLVNRIRGRGKHAGGLIISSVPIDTLVPLCIDADGNPVSAWTEGLHAQDLQPVGLVKYDVLGLTNLEQLSQAVQIIGNRVKNNLVVDSAEGASLATHCLTDEITSRYGLKELCALPGKGNWTDVRYLNDLRALELGNQGKLRCVFQFDSGGMRELVKRGGIHSFDDLAAYTALYRPGPLGSGMAANYCDRKNGLEPYEIHPIMEPVLGSTYGVLVYQEQVMQLLNVVGGIPLKDCEIVRKAISKKKVEKFIKYKNQFMEEGQCRLTWPKDKVEELWAYIEAFADYGFNKSHAVAYTYISSRLLYLKAHYPLEFFTAILSCEEDDKKVKEYKTEAQRFGITINRIDINKSKSRFSIVDNSIYIGFANIKGIGDEPAARIVAGQPYVDFEDFITRFGADAAVLKPLLGLRCFKDASPVTLYEFAEYHKDETAKRVERDKRNLVSRDKIVNELVYLMVQTKGLGSLTEAQATELQLEAAEYLVRSLGFTDFEHDVNATLLLWNGNLDTNGMSKAHKSILKQYRKVADKYKKNVQSNLEKKSKDTPIRLCDFEQTGTINPKLADIYRRDVEYAEEQFYGFGWIHPLELSPDYEGLTFAEFKQKAEIEDINTTLVEVRLIQKPLEKKSKNGNSYYVLRVEDAEWQSEGVTVWAEDFKRFEPELMHWNEDLKDGHLLKMRLQAPMPPFPNYTFESPPKATRHRIIPEKKEDDVRLTVMTRGSFAGNK